jgi:hypothetical protein
VFAFVFVALDFLARLCARLCRFVFAVLALELADVFVFCPLVV